MSCRLRFSGKGAGNPPALVNAGSAGRERIIMVLTTRNWSPVILLALGSLLPFGCSSGGATEIASVVEARGSLVLPLVSANEPSFRLRSAVFQLSLRSGETSLRLDSETDPAATSVRAELAQAEYTIALEDGWSLERLSGDGTVSVLHAALMSPNPTDFEIHDGRVARLVYTFSTDEGIVRFGAGAVEIGVAITQPATVPCHLLDAASCPGEQTCLLSDDTGQTFCAEPGSSPVGSPCDSEQCVPGAQCLKLDPADPAAGVCARFCNPDVTEFGCTCRSVSFDAAIGVCEPPPFPTCDPLGPVGCGEGEACQHASGNFAVCGVPGSGQVGDGCLGETCAAGLDCYGDVPELGISGTCRQFCDTRVSNACPYYYPYYQTCQDVGTANLGRCL
jgi:hypothetical protein